jgi:hypothetical protein
VKEKYNSCGFMNTGYACDPSDDHKIVFKESRDEVFRNNIDHFSRSAGCRCSQTAARLTPISESRSSIYVKRVTYRAHGGDGHSIQVFGLESHFPCSGDRLLVEAVSKRLDQ